MMALLIIALVVALLALVAARVAASPLVRCIAGCFDSWAEASHAEPTGRS